jgi:hypothetical protein
MRSVFKVINHHHGPAASRPGAYQLNIMRPGLLGNPYSIGHDGSREEVIEKYRAFLATAYDFDPKIRTIIHSLQECFETGVEVDLICCCKPKPCHGDVIVEFVVDKEIPF